MGSLLGVSVEGSGTFSSLGQVPPQTFSTPDLFYPELLDLIYPKIFPPQPFATAGPRVKNVPGWKMSHSGKSLGWKRSGVENVWGGTCPRVEKVPEPFRGLEEKTLVKFTYLGILLKIVSDTKTVIYVGRY